MHLMPIPEIRNRESRDALPFAVIQLSILLFREGHHMNHNSPDHMALRFPHLSPDNVE